MKSKQVDKWDKMLVIVKETIKNKGTFNKPITLLIFDQHIQKTESHKKYVSNIFVVSLLSKKFLNLKMYYNFLSYLGNKSYLG